MNKDSKIIGFYSYIREDKDNNETRLYIYVSKNKETGKISYHVTDENSEEYKTVFAKYCKDNGYNKLNQDRIFVDDPNKINIRCDSKEEIFDLIKAANRYEKEEVDEEEYNKAFTEYDAKHNESKKTFKNLKNSILSSVKNLKITRKIKRFVAGLVIGITALSVGGFALKSCSDKSENAIVNESDSFTNDDTNFVNNDKLKDFINRVTLAVNRIADGVNNLNDRKDSENETTSNTSSDNSDDYSAPIERPPEEEIHHFQDPGASIDDSSNSNNNSSNNNEESNKEENLYQDVIVEEEPTINNTNQDNSDKPDEVIEVPAPTGPENGSNNDEENENNDEYSEIIVVPADDEETNTPDEPSNETIGTDDLVLNDEYNANIGAIDNVTYVPSEEWGNIIVEEVPSPNPLPNPDETAMDGNYVSNEEELESDYLVPVEQESQALESVSTVPVEQKTKEQAIDEAVNAMANGEEGNLVIREDGTIDFEQTNNQVVETNVLTK